GGTQAHVNQKTHQETHAGNPMADMPKGERASNRKKSRRLYRNPEEAFMGGVCAGLSDYFGIEDPLWVRMAFAVSFFTGGWGVLPYILLWAIVPEAKTPAQKLAMRGEPINVSNIEKIVKEGMDNLKSTIEDFSKGENGQKTRFFFKQATHEVKTAAPKVFKVGGSVLKGFMIFFGIIMLISLGTALVAIVGSLFAFSKFLVTFVFASSLPITLVSISTVFLIGIPILFISYSVLRRAFNVRLQSASWGRGLVTLWVLSLVSLIAVGGTTYDKNFSSKSHTMIPAESLAVNAQTLNLKVLEDNDYTRIKSATHEMGNHQGATPLKVDLPDVRFGDVIFDTESKAIYVEKVKLDIEQSETDHFEVVKTVSARGGSASTAQKIAEKINHQMDLQDETLFVSPYYKIDQADKWRFQEYHITLKVPVGKAVYFDEALYGDRYEVIYDIKNTTDTYDGDMVGKTWLMTEEGLKEWKADKIITLTGQTNQTGEETAVSYPSVAAKSFNDGTFKIPAIRNTDHSKTFDIVDFEELDIQGNFNVYVEQGSEFSVVLVTHESENRFEKVEIEKDGNTLDVSMNSKWSFFSKSSDGNKLDLYLTMPELSEVELSGTSHAVIKDFNGEQINMDISGASSCNMSIEVDKMVAEMSGASNMNLVGKSERMFLDLSGASSLNAYDFNAVEVEAELSGASHGHIHVQESLDADVSGASQMLYVGSPAEVRSEVSGAAHLTKVNIE
ncbi:MAG: DUF2807 domain-containing protein, partial [Chitinophagales bacterium]